MVRGKESGVNHWWRDADTGGGFGAGTLKS